MPTKTVRRSPVKKAAAKKIAPAKKANKKVAAKPKVNFMARILKEREEQRKVQEKNHNSNVIQLHPNSRSGYVNNHGFSRFNGPRRKAA